MIDLTGCHWQTVTHLHLDNQYVRVDLCPQLGFCRQTTTLKRGWKVIEQIYFFEGEAGEDDPVYTWPEILKEADYRRAVREGRNE